MAYMRVRLKFDPGVVMYLIVIDQMIAKYRDIMMARPTEKFQSMVHKEVMTYVIDGKEPPEQIRTAVMNIADDMMAGRDVTLRAGDYIDMMNYARERKMV
jgi:uncharacterized protein (UPF0147 family)